MHKPTPNPSGVSRRSPVESSVIASLLIVLSYAIMTPIAGAESVKLSDAATALSVVAMQNQTIPFGSLPAAKLRGPYYVKVVTATAYNSLPEQTDETPFITASGRHVRHGIVAANFLPIGTQITLPDIYGDEIFVVEDRMNARYQNNIDIWMEGLAEAKDFGRREIKIHVYTAGL